jgi:site-specific recombinase XerD
MDKVNTFSISFYLRKDKMDDKNTAPVFMRVTVNGERAEISTNRRFDVSKWRDGHPVGLSQDTKEFQKYLDSLKNLVYSIHRDLFDHHELITAEKIKNRFYNQDETTKTLIEVFEYHNDQVKKLIGKDFSPATYKRYETTLVHVKNFLKHTYKSEDILLRDIKYDFITSFDFYLKTIRECSHNSSLKYLKNFRKIIYLALKNEWLTRDPFLKFSAKIQPVEREFLSSEELTKIEQKTFIINRIERVRDIFVFACYTGLAYVDVSKLTRDNIVTGIDGLKWIFINRTKTNIRSRIPLLPKAEEMLEKYLPSRSEKDGIPIFPDITNQKMNAYLKEVADLCGINKILTFHMARHTFATTVTLTNGVPIESVSSMLGHKSIRTTQIYSKVVEEKVGFDMNLLRKRLDKNNQVKKPKSKLLKSKG